MCYLRIWMMAFNNYEFAQKRNEMNKILENVILGLYKKIHSLSTKAQLDSSGM